MCRRDTTVEETYIKVGGKNLAIVGCHARNNSERRTPNKANHATAGLSSQSSRHGSKLPRAYERMVFLRIDIPEVFHNGLPQLC